MATRTLLALALSALLGGCAFHTTARAWNGRVGPDGEPMFYSSTTKVGLNLFVLIPLIGNTAVDGIVDDLTAYIASINGDRVRLVEGSSENYWYAIPLVTWIITPVISTVSAEFHPSEENLYNYSEIWAGTDPKPKMTGTDEDADGSDDDGDGDASGGDEP